MALLRSPCNPYYTHLIIVTGLAVLDTAATTVKERESLRGRGAAGGDASHRRSRGALRLEEARLPRARPRPGGPDARTLPPQPSDLRPRPPRGSRPLGRLARERRDPHRPRVHLLL